MKAEVKAEPVEDSKQPSASAVQLGLKKKTILDVPPEARRRPKPTYGGLIHFAPDWEAKVGVVGRGGQAVVVPCRLVRVAPHVRGQRGVAVRGLRRSCSAVAASAVQPRARQRRLQVRGQRAVRRQGPVVVPAAEGRSRGRGGVPGGQVSGLLLLLGMVRLLLLLLLVGVMAVLRELVVEGLQVLHVLVRVERARRRRWRGRVVRGRSRAGERPPRGRGLLPGIPGGRVPVLFRHSVLLFNHLSGRVQHRYPSLLAVLESLLTHQHILQRSNSRGLTNFAPSSSTHSLCFVN